MPFFRCTICECCGDAIAQGVMVTLAETERDNWFGMITAEHLTTLTAGDSKILLCYRSRYAFAAPNTTPANTALNVNSVR